MYSTAKRFLIGPPLASSEEQHQRLTKLVALAVFSSDAISSTAYATEEILHELLKHGTPERAFSYLVPIALIVGALLAIVVTSYRQTIYAYPSGGGSYVVSRENLGTYPSLVAGSSLLVDYILTVSVSVAGGVAAIISAFPELREHRVSMCLFFVALMTVANLRGLKESGKLFAPPVYLYIGALILLCGIGTWRIFVGDLGPIPGGEERFAEFLAEENLATGSLTGIGLFVLMRAFASGAVALTGVEAVSNGVPAFKKPESRNAAVTLLYMAVILGIGFFVISVVAHHLQPIPSPDSTVNAQMAEHIFGGKNVAFYYIQFATFAVLILAANTAYADFPRLSSIIARDGFLPRQFANRGDRLVFSNGVIILALAASALLVIFGGTVNALIPLYAIGVFTSFTLSQAGMVVHHFKEKEKHWQIGAAINTVGCIATFIVALVVLISKFAIGAWIPAVLIPIMVIVLRAIKRHYDDVRTHTHIDPGYKVRRRTHTVVLLVGGVNRGVLEAVAYARSLAPDRLMAVSVVADNEEQEALSRAWVDFGIPIELHTISSPYRELTQPILDYLDELDADDPDDWITVIIPEFVVTGWYSQILHNQSALALKARLLFRPHTVVTSIPTLVE
jgi:amino acid transporter